jgi:YD repeat-containing protein
MYARILWGLFVAACLQSTGYAQESGGNEPQAIEVKLGGEIDFYKVPKKLEFGIAGFYGLAHFDIPLNLPVSGRQAPSLSLSYISTRKIGSCGLGCDLRIPSIRKSSKAPVSSSDSGFVYTAGSGSTRLIKEGEFLYLESAGSASRFRQTATGFIMHDGYGGTSHFGFGENTILRGNDEIPLIWRLGYTEDAFGSRVLYKWSAENIQEISYGAASMKFVASFDWQKTAIVHSDHSSQDKISAVLVALRVKRGTDEVRRFELEYVAPIATQMWPRLKAVFRKASNLTEKLATLDFADEVSPEFSQVYSEPILVPELSDSRLRLVKSSKTGRSHLILISKVGGAGQIQLFSWNNGAPKWSNLGNFGDGDPSNYRLSDVDSDSAEDLVFVSPLKTVHVAFIDYEAGTLSHKQYGTISFTTYREDVDSRTYRNVTFQSGRYWMGDVTGDGAPEMFFVDHHGVVSQSALVTSSGSYSFANHITFGEGEQLSRYVFADVNGDGRNDLVLVTRDGRLLAALSDGIKLQAPSQLTSALPSTGSVDFRLLAADYNGDGLVDFLFLNNDQVSIYINNPGQPQNPLVVRAAPSIGVASSKVTPVSLNGDLYVDLIQSGSDALYAYVSGSNGYSRSRVELTANPTFDALPWSDRARIVRATDLNGDGRPDVIVIDSTNTFRVFLSRQNNHKVLSDGLVEKLYNEFGGFTEFRYASSSDYSQSSLPVGLSLIDRVRQTSSAYATSLTDTDWITYRYEKGFVHPASGEFRGFGRVTETTPTSKEGHVLKRESIYHQGDGDGKTPSDPRAEVARYAGLLHTRITTAGNWIETEKFEYASPAVPPFLRLKTRSDILRCVGDSSPENCAGVSELTKHDLFGNELQKSRRDFQTGLEDYFSQTDYNFEESKWLIHRIKKSVTRNSSAGPLLESSEFFYNGSVDCPSEAPFPGVFPTSIEKWVDHDVTIKEQMGYDQLGNLRCRFNGRNRIQTTFDESGTVATRVTNSLGLKVDMEYYGIHVAAEPSKVGLLAIRRDENNVPVAFDYDALGRRAYVSKPDCMGLSESCARYRFFYIDWGVPEKQRIRVIEAHDIFNEAVFDGMGNVVSNIRSGPAGEVIRQDRQYDNEGLLRKLSVPYFLSQGATEHWFDFSYDALRRRVALRWPDGSKQIKCYHPSHQTIIDPAGKTLRIWLDGSGRNIRAEDFDAVHMGCPSANASPYSRIMFSYDALDRVVVYERDRGILGARAYNGLGKLSESFDSDSGRMRYIYDIFGRLSDRIDAGGASINFTYDALDRVVEEKLINASGATEDKMLYYYDSVSQNSINRVSAVRSNLGLIRYIYDSSGQVSEQLVEHKSEIFSTKYERDGIGRVRKLISPDGQIVDYLYSGTQPVSISSGGAVIARAEGFVPSGKPRTIFFGNGMKSMYSYGVSDAKCGLGVFRLCEIKVDEVGGEGRSFGGRRYHFDSRGAVIRVNLGNEGIETYDYDNLGRLIKSSSTGLINNVINYEYDSLHRMTSRTGLGKYHYGSTDAPSLVPTGVGDESMAFDSAGRLNNSGLYSAAFNARGELVSVREKLTGLTTDYQRDAAGNKIIQKTGARTTIFPSPKIDCSSANACGIFLDWNGMPIAYLTKSATQYLHGDISNNIWLITGANRSVIERGRYDAFGSRIWTQVALETTGVKRRAFGKEELSVASPTSYEGRGLQLSDFGFRVMDSRVGIFVQPDVLPLPLVDPRFANRYSFGLQNPMLYLDPSGAMSENERSTHIFNGTRSIMIAVAQSMILAEGGFAVPGVNALLATDAYMNAAEGVLEIQAGLSGDSTMIDTFQSATDIVGQVASLAHYSTQGNFRDAMKFGASAADIASLRNLLERPDRIIEAVRANRVSVQTVKEFMEVADKMFKGANMGEAFDTARKGLDILRKDVERFTGGEGKTYEPKLNEKPARGGGGAKGAGAAGWPGAATGARGGGSPGGGGGGGRAYVRDPRM